MMSRASGPMGSGTDKGLTAATAHSKPISNWELSVDLEEEVDPNTCRKKKG